MSVLGTHLYQYSSWHCCERLHLASVNIVWRLFQCFCPFHDGWFRSTRAECPAVFDQSRTPVYNPPHSHDLAQRDSFVSLDKKKSSKGNVLPVWKRWNKKGRSTKRHQNKQVQKLFKAVEKSLRKYIASNVECFDGDGNLNM